MTSGDGGTVKCSIDLSQRKDTLSNEMYTVGDSGILLVGGCANGRYPVCLAQASEKDTVKLKIWFVWGEGAARIFLC